MILYLIGFMGSGKTHTGRLLAHALDVPHIDLDQWIEEKYEATISMIFAREGEEEFRKKETQALEEIYNGVVASGPLNDVHGHIQLIISTGGGAPCFNGNMEWMSKHGLTVWLDPPLEILLQRLEKEKSHRPLLANLTNEEMVNFVTQKLKERSVFYTQSSLRISEEEIDIQSFIKSITHAQDIR